MGIIITLVLVVLFAWALYEALEQRNEQREMVKEIEAYRKERHWDAQKGQWVRNDEGQYMKVLHKDESISI